MMKKTGFSLLEILIAVLVFGVLSLLIGFFIHWSLDESRKIGQGINQDIHFNQLSAIINDPESIISSRESTEISLGHVYFSQQEMLKKCFTGSPTPQCDQSVVAGSSGYYPFTLYSPSKSRSGHAIPSISLAGIDGSGREIRYTRDGRRCNNTESDENCPIWARAFFKPICSSKTSPQYPCKAASSFLFKIRADISPAFPITHPQYSMLKAKADVLKATVEFPQYILHASAQGSSSSDSSPPPYSSSENSNSESSVSNISSSAPGSSSEPPVSSAPPSSSSSSPATSSAQSSVYSSAYSSAVSSTPATACETNYPPFTDIRLCMGYIDDTSISNTTELNRMSCVRGDAVSATSGDVLAQRDAPGYSALEQYRGSLMSGVGDMDGIRLIWWGWHDPSKSNYPITSIRVDVHGQSPAGVNPFRHVAGTMQLLGTGTCTLFDQKCLQLWDVVSTLVPGPTLWGCIPNTDTSAIPPTALNCSKSAITPLTPLKGSPHMEFVWLNMYLKSAPGINPITRLNMGVNFGTGGNNNCLGVQTNMNPMGTTMLDLSVATQSPTNSSVALMGPDLVTSYSAANMHKTNLISCNANGWRFMVFGMSGSRSPTACPFSAYSTR